MKTIFQRTLTALALAAIAITTTQAQTFTTLHAFNGTTDGKNPYGLPVISDGLIYGTTLTGGTNQFGTIWDYNLSTGAFTVLYQGKVNGTSGGVANFYAGVYVQQTSGSLGPKIFGAATAGSTGGNGSFFVLQDGIVNSLANFTHDLKFPYAAPMLGTDGLFYGTLGKGLSGQETQGGVYSVQPNGGKYQIVGTFYNGAGGGPRGGVVEIDNGFLFAAGGQIITQLDNGKLLYNSNPEGQYIYGGMVTDGVSGNLYGTTYGTNSGALGTLFKVDTSTGKVTLFHTFTGTDGANPCGAVVRDSAGNIFGTTLLGGANNMGTVFEYSAGGVFTTLYSFAGGDDGKYPYAGLVFDVNGNAYGVTKDGGANGDGVLFRISGL